jgi:hypothetical protein
MLVLNPSDNQGVRYTLAGYFLFLDRDEDLVRLLGQYPDEGTARWSYTRALLAYRQRGDTPEARQLLERARKANRHIPDYLMDRKHPPHEQPNFYSPGDDNEALVYIAGFLAVWKYTPGAVAWLQAADAIVLAARTMASATSGFDSKHCCKYWPTLASTARRASSLVSRALVAPANSGRASRTETTADERQLYFPPTTTRIPVLIRHRMQVQTR